MIETGKAEHYLWGDRCDGWHLVRAGHLSVIEERMPPGTSEVAHRHQRAHQFFYVLAGTLTIRLGDRVEHLAARQGLEVPPGVPHQAVNEADGPVQFLVVSAPPSHGDRRLD